jgi:hypothetical protein
VDISGNIPGVLHLSLILTSFYPAEETLAVIFDFPGTWRVSAAWWRLWLVFGISTSRC